MVCKETEYATQNTLISKKQKYSKKLHDKQKATELEDVKTPNDGNGFGERKQKLSQSRRTRKDTEMVSDVSNERSKEIQKLSQKKKIQRKGYESGAGKNLLNPLDRDGIGDSIKAFLNNVQEKIVTWLAENPLPAIIAALLLIMVLVVCGTTSSCSMLGGGAGDVSIATTYTAEDEDILAVDEDYTELEEGLQDYIDEFETNNPDYDEYVYILDEIGHLSRKSLMKKRRLLRRMFQRKMEKQN